MLKKIELRENGSHIAWINEEKKVVGSGFKTNQGTIGLLKCPSCLAENVAQNVLTGYCSWCDFNVHDIKEKK